MEEKPNDKFSRKEAADYLGVSIVTIDRLVSAKKIGHFRIGSRVIFDKKHLEDFLITCEQKTKKSVI